ncbi:tripartite tricarboxylate transporter permease [Streptomyces sp. AJS327]|uniref:tripartite tricarboxylate transporter permease n=1 Tax=Streptomyces sp. AJS327 TaxID=2545265 RepID=UPI0015DFF20D|nr:tripartite tricarboxylate transporter permease [Streptomyces sp. AJS327]MBA0052680.1 tripartite tricarboxylate transporter permease [Streptomyces sp. AJS327]
MDALSSLMDGFGTALAPVNLMWAAIGVLLGTAIGVLPGIGPAMAVALLLPVTYGLDPVGAFIMFAGIYYGGMFGGSTTSILLNTPGETAAVIAAVEGHPMAKAGRGSQALAAAAIGHFAGGLIGTVLLVMLAPTVAELAVDIGAPDYLAVMVLAFIAVTSVLGSSRVRGFASLLIGLTLGLVGLDQMTGQQRLTFGSLQLSDGIDVVIVAVGLFAIGEALWMAARPGGPGGPGGATGPGRKGRGTAPEAEPVGRPWLGRAELRRSWKPWLRGPLIGFPFGAIPAGGAEIPTFLSYITEKRLSRHRKEFGKGAIEGVAGPESAASASAAGTLVSMLTLGLPTTAVAAVLLAAFQSYGIQPGPLLFEREPELVWGLIASLFVGMVMLLVLNLPLAPVWAKLLRVPRPYLYAGILFFAAVGAYAVGGEPIDLVILLVIGLLGLLMRRFDLPVLPAIIGVILGPAAEQQLRRALQISDGSVTGLVNTPFSVTVYAVIALVLAWPWLKRLLWRPRRRVR